jgi:phenylpyruvate tautomerase PptA (4-oxalocrotonate tautomerase family)
VRVSKMNILNAALSAIMLVIVTMTIRDWIRAIKEAREEQREKRAKMKFYKCK